MTRIAVVGHVEWVDFLAVAQLPALGQITPARRLAMNAAGGAVVAAAVLAELGAEVEFFGACGSDAHGDRAVRELEARGITVQMARRNAPTREMISLIDARGERSLVTVGERHQPEGADPLDWSRLSGADGVYFTAGDSAALSAARAARTLVATPRIAERLGEAIEVELDALVYSNNDRAEREWAAGLRGHSRLVVATDGDHGGSWSGVSSGQWPAAPLPGPVVDNYGAGDSFAAGFTFGLAVSGDPSEAARIGAECGARAMTRPGGP